MVHGPPSPSARPSPGNTPRYGPPFAEGPGPIGAAHCSLSWHWEFRVDGVLSSSALLWCSEALTALAHITFPLTRVWCRGCIWRLGAAIKANPPRGGGAKPMDLSSSREVAGLPNGGGVTIHTESPEERAPPPDIARGWGLSVCLHPPCVSLFGPLLFTATSERG